VHLATPGDQRDQAGQARVIDLLLGHRVQPGQPV
jgi:hypothetical protein